MGKVYPIQKPIINYSDTLFVYKFHEGEIRRHAVTDHTLVYVYSGEMTIVNKAKTTKKFIELTLFKNIVINLEVCSESCTFAASNIKRVPQMSGLRSYLQT